ncbi:tRNA-dihydrouridine synthase [Succinatimonas hippei]|uniref:tRNA-dihydrouridine synthase n=1 Tax=Succinatimonas hippei TaxID=626938 RepID=UPI0023F6922A|nr:tRNA-dihydrouridine synthase [Succinatimonas hippei]
MQINKVYLAPMEGVADPPLRKVLTAHGNYDECFSEFIRVTDVVLPYKTLEREVPELKENNARTASGTLVRVQLLGDNPQTIAATAVRAVKLGARSIDINFGCPSRFVHHGGAMLLKEPDLMHEIVLTVRDALLPEIFLSVKVRTGFLSKEEAPEIVSAIAVDGVDEIIMHARTRKDLYSEAALDWSVIGRVREYAHGIPMVANGDILSFEDGQQCSEAAKTDRLMVGRGALSIPNAGAVLKDGAEPYTTSEVLKVVDEFIQELISRRFQEKSVLDRAKQFLGFARRTDKKLVEFFKLFCRENSVDKARKLIETSISQYDN